MDLSPKNSQGSSTELRIMDFKCYSYRFRETNSLFDFLSRFTKNKLKHLSLWIIRSSICWCGPLKHNLWNLKKWFELGKLEAGCHAQWITESFDQENNESCLKELFTKFLLISFLSECLMEVDWEFQIFSLTLLYLL